MGQALLEIGFGALQLTLLVLEGRLIDKALNIGIEEALKLTARLCQLLGVQPTLLRFNPMLIGEDGIDRIPQPGGLRLIREPHPFEIRDDAGFKVVAAPPHRCMPSGFMLIPTLVVEVDVCPSVEELFAFQLAGHRRSALGTAEEPPAEGNLRAARTPITPVEDVLAAVELFPGDQRLDLGGKGLPVVLDLTHVDPIVEDPRQGRAMETRHGGAIDAVFGSQGRHQPVEGRITLAEQLENTNDSGGLLRLRHHGAGAIGNVPVTEGCPPHGPALAHLLPHAFQHLSPQVVAVILTDGCQHVEAEHAGRPGGKMVIAEVEADPAFAFQIMEQHRITHVAAGAVKLVGQDAMHLTLLRFGSNPGDHGLELVPFSTLLG